MILNRFYRYIFSVQLVTLGLFTNAAAKPRIIPLRTSINVSSRSTDIRRSLSIKSTNGTTAYILSLEPDFDIGHHLLTLELVLRRPRDSADAPNLLDSTGRRHGLQAYDFAANDLSQGVRKSAFGQTRTVTLTGLGLVVRIDLIKASVSPISAGKYQIDELEMKIEVSSNP